MRNDSQGASRKRRLRISIWRIGVLAGIGCGVAAFSAKRSVAVPIDSGTPLTDRKATDCKIQNPIVLRGAVNAFGTHGRTCDLSNGELTMEVTDRDGDFALCCVDIDEPLDLTDRSRVSGCVNAEKSEPKVDLKLEVPDSPKHIFVMREALVSGHKSASHTLTEVEKKWRPKRICLGAVGNKGPIPNTLHLRSIGFGP